MKKFVKTSLISIAVILGFIILVLSLYISLSLIKYSTIGIDNELLSSKALNIEIYDTKHNKIKEENSFNGNYVKLSSLPSYVKEAFISIEDKDFYSHHGINYSRIIKALINNIKSFSYKEGASTISQQLIKNTHLSGEKTITRKLKEIALTKKLEKNYPKDQILEFYLNVIYFGNNNYGIEEASNYYFSKESQALSLDEASMLAGIIKSPKNYSPISNKDACLLRRNLVIDQMAKDEKITFSEALKYKNKPITLNINSNKEDKLNSYSEQVIDEAVSILKMPAKQIAIGGFKLYTYQDNELQNSLEKALTTTDFNGNDYGSIMIDNSSSGIVAFKGESSYKILENRRQPGSTIKPILVYAPALEKNIISPSTQILDEPINISDFSPKNVDGKFHGYVSIKEALSKSYNIPAVKVLSYTGINEAKYYASQAGIVFDKNDNSYALALGGMTYGTTIKELTSTYTTFANGGKFAPPKFIKFIEDKHGKIIYKHSPNYKQVFRDDTAYLITDMLKDSAKNGTAKKLASIDGELASKTGTVGIKGKKENLDAWNITYSSSYTLGTWTGNLDNTPISLSGGNEPTLVAKQVFSNLQNPAFTKPSSIVEKEIDLVELKDNHKVVLSNNQTPERYKESAIFSRFNEPENISLNYLLPPKIDATIEMEGNKKYLTFNTKEYLKYTLVEKTQGIILSEIKNKKEKAKILLEDNKSYILEVCYLDGSLPNTKEFEVKPITSTFHNNKNKKWYI